MFSLPSRRGERRTPRWLDTNSFIPKKVNIPEVPMTSSERRQRNALIRRANVVDHNEYVKKIVMPSAKRPLKDMTYADMTFAAEQTLRRNPNIPEHLAIHPMVVMPPQESIKGGGMRAFSFRPFDTKNERTVNEHVKLKAGNLKPCSEEITFFDTTAGTSCRNPTKGCKPTCYARPPEMAQPSTYLGRQRNLAASTMPDLDLQIASEWDRVGKTKGARWRDPEKGKYLRKEAGDIRNQKELNAVANAARIAQAQDIGMGTSPRKVMLYTKAHDLTWGTKDNPLPSNVEVRQSIDWTETPHKKDIITLTRAKRGGGVEKVKAATTLVAPKEWLTKTETGWGLNDMGKKFMADKGYDDYAPTTCNCGVDGRSWKVVGHNKDGTEIREKCKSGCMSKTWQKKMAELNGTELPMFEEKTNKATGGTDKVYGEDTCEFGCYTHKDGTDDLKDVVLPLSGDTKEPSAERKRLVEYDDQARLYFKGL